MIDAWKNISSTSIGTCGSVSNVDMSSVDSGMTTSGTAIREGDLTWGGESVGAITVAPSPWTSSLSDWTRKVDIPYETIETTEPKVVHTPGVLYAESILPHLVRTKEEGIRRKIEMDTVVIDRGVAVAQGLDHADMILGLKVKYAKEGSLPMDSAFIMLKDKDKATEAGGTSTKAAEAAPKSFLEIVDDDGARILLGLSQITKILDYRSVHGRIVIETSGGSMERRVISVNNPERADAIMESLEPYICNR